MQDWVNKSDDCMALPAAAVVIPEIFAISCSICGFAGNFLTILTIVLTPKLNKNANNWFVCNLSVVDGLFCAFALPIQASMYHNREQPWGDQFCVWLAALKHVIFGTSLMTLCMIVSNRYIYVIHPELRSRLFNKYNIVILILLCWMLPFSLHVGTIIGVWGSFGYESRALICTFKTSDSVNDRSHRIVVSTLGLFLLILFMGFCYTRIAFAVFSSQKRIQQRVRLQHRGTNRRVLQLTKTMTIICVLFVLCIAPYNLFDPDFMCAECHLLTPMLGWIQISLNPIIYTTTNSQFHDAYKRIISILKCKRNMSTPDITGFTPSDVTGSVKSWRKTEKETRLMGWHHVPAMVP